MNEIEVDSCATASLGFVICAIVQALICGFGLVLNTVTIRTVWKTRKRCKLFDHLLICLLVFDCVVLLTAPIFLFGIKHKFFHCITCAYLVQYWCFPVGHMGTFGTVFMTLAISHERYLAIRDPLHYNRSLIEESTQRQRLITYIIPTIIFTIGANIPRFFTFKVEKEGNNVELLLDLGCNENYLFYYTFLFNTIPFGLIPCGLLIFFGFQTHKRLRDQRNQSRRSSIYNIEENKLKLREEEEMAKVMVAIVAVFIITHFARFFLHTLDGITRERWDRCSQNRRRTGKEDKYLLAVGISIFMEIINSSIGPIVYSVIHATFRNELVNRFKKITTICR